MALSQEQVEQWLAILTLNTLLLTAILAQMITEEWEKTEIKTEHKP